MFLSDPLDVTLNRLGSGSSVHPYMKEEGHHDEEAEEQDLEDETADDDVLAGGQCRLSVAGHDPTACLRQSCQSHSSNCKCQHPFSSVIDELTRSLHQKRKHVSADKYLGEPSQADDGMRRAVRESDDTS